MQTYYHVAQSNYDDGDLLSFASYELEYGECPAYKWDSEQDFDLYTDSIDSRVVCVFESLSDAEEFRAEYGGIILRIDLPDWAIDERIVDKTRVGEGYTAFFDRIPAEFISRA